MLSIIIPAYNEADNIVWAITEIRRTLAETVPGMATEIIVVDDHSSDGTRENVLSLGLANIHCIRLSRRSGSHTAIRAGLKYASGDAALLISADGQDRPEAILEMVDKWRNGAHVIWALRHYRAETFFSKIFTKVFFWLLHSMLDPQIRTVDWSRTGFFMLDRKVMDAINQCPERNTSLGGLIAWAGFTQDTVEYEPRLRKSGKSKWNFRMRLHAAMDWIIAFSGLPLKLMIVAGFLIAGLGFLYAVVIIANALKGNSIQGWSSLAVAILVLGGFQILLMGIMGEYIWRNLDESRRRPIYFIESNSLAAIGPRQSVSEIQSVC